MTKIAIFASGSGSNAENIIQYFQGIQGVDVVLVLSNRKDSYVLTRALKYSIPTFVFTKNELNNTTQNVVTESMEKIGKSPASGSSQNLIESKTYENPQFLRMKDIMQKIQK